MSYLHELLRKDDEYKGYGELLALQCRKWNHDTTLIGAKSPIHSENADTYFTEAFLHGLMMYYEDQRPHNSWHVDKYQVFLGVFAMEHGVEIEKDDLERMQHALIRSDIGAHHREKIGEAFAEYGRTGSLDRLEMGGEWVLVNRGE